MRQRMPQKGNKKSLEVEGSFALAIGLIIIPMNWIAYWALAFGLVVVCARLVWWSVRPTWPRWIISVLVIGALISVLAPEMLARLPKQLPGDTPSKPGAIFGAARTGLR